MYHFSLNMDDKRPDSVRINACTSLVVIVISYYSKIFHVYNILDRPFLEMATVILRVSVVQTYVVKNKTITRYHPSLEEG